jgi:hypothetical protein
MVARTTRAALIGELAIHDVFRLLFLNTKAGLKEMDSAAPSRERLGHLYWSNCMISLLDLFDDLL